MTTNELKQVIKIIGSDRKHLHFARRIQKDFQESQTKGIPVAMRAFFAADDNQNAVGFAIISISPLKMRQWEETFRQEGWTDESFGIDISSFELMYLYIQPRFRRKGKGTFLFKKVIAYAQKVGIKKIYAYVSDTTGLGLHFYRKNNATLIRDFSSKEEGVSTAYLVWKV
ncbi:MAG: GNAT family N-acetyltransferase [Patescibacteria group bacterium]